MESFAVLKRERHWHGNILLFGGAIRSACGKLLGRPSMQSIKDLDVFLSVELRRKERALGYSEREMFLFGKYRDVIRWLRSFGKDVVDYLGIMDQDGVLYRPDADHNAEYKTVFEIQPEISVNRMGVFSDGHFWDEGNAFRDLAEKRLRLVTGKMDAGLQWFNLFAALRLLRFKHEFGWEMNKDLNDLIVSTDYEHAFNQWKRWAFFTNAWIRFRTRVLIGEIFSHAMDVVSLDRDLRALGIYAVVEKFGVNRNILMKLSARAGQRVALNLKGEKEIGSSFVDQAMLAGEPKDCFEPSGNAEADEDLIALRDRLVKELRYVKILLERVPPAISIFGGNQSGHKEFFLGQVLGKELYHRGMLPRTGGGPGGAMEGSFVGMIAARGKKGLTRFRLRMTKRYVLPHLVWCPVWLARWLLRGQSQGFKIYIREQAMNPHVEVSAMFTHFVPRKMSLMRNVQGVIVMPGGFGTLDELFEVMRTDARVVAFPFWQPVIAAIEQAWRHYGWHETIFDELVFTCDANLYSPEKVAEETVNLIEGKGRVAKQKNTEIGSEVEGIDKIISEIRSALTKLCSFPPALVISGSSQVTNKEDTSAAEQVAKWAIAHHIPIRLGGTGPVAEAVLRGIPDKADRKKYLQATVIEDQRVRTHHTDVYDELVKTGNSIVVFDPIVHKLLMAEHALGHVIMPGMWGTMDLVTDLLDRRHIYYFSHGNRAPPTPLVLVNQSFWQPQIDTILSTLKPYYKPGAEKILTVAGSAAQAQQILETSLVTDQAMLSYVLHGVRSTEHGVRMESYPLSVIRYPSSLFGIHSSRVPFFGENQESFRGWNAYPWRVVSPGVRRTDDGVRTDALGFDPFSVLHSPFSIFWLHIHIQTTDRAGRLIMPQQEKGESVSSRPRRVGSVVRTTSSARKDFAMLAWREWGLKKLNMQAGERDAAGKTAADYRAKFKQALLAQPELIDEMLAQP
ncbi:MAG TPA: LOG family protein, partial [Candidatus Bathyarchaeia archaeon]|nr:LOG family protein [Candidatus Bathyarchaeia archaeon]